MDIEQNIATTKTIAQQSNKQLGAVVKKDYQVPGSKINMMQINLNVHLAYDDTFLFYKNENFVHATPTGQIISQLKAVGFSEAKAHMVTETDVVIFSHIKDLKCCKLIHWSLKDKDAREYEWPHPWTQFFVFPDTKLLCFIERSNQYYEDSTPTKMTYLQFPFDNIKDHVVFQLVIPQDIQPELRRKASRLNHHSGIYWKDGSSDDKDYDEDQQHRLQFLTKDQLRNKEENKQTIRVFDLRRKQQGIRTLTLVHNQNPRPQLFSMNLVDAWEPIFGTVYVKFSYQLMREKFKSLFKYQGRRYNLKAAQIVRKLFQEETTHQFLWNYQQGKHWVPKFASKQRQQNVVQFINGFREVETIKFNHQHSRIYSYIPGFRPGYLPTWRKISIHYIDPVQEKLLFIESSNEQSLNSNYHLICSCPQFDKYKMIELKIWSKDQEVVNKIIIKKLNQFRQPISLLYSDMLTQLVDECCQDLIYEVVRLTESQSWVRKQIESGWEMLDKLRRFQETSAQELF